MPTGRKPTLRLKTQTQGPSHKSSRIKVSLETNSASENLANLLESKMKVILFRLTLLVNWSQVPELLNMWNDFDNERNPCSISRSSGT